MWHNKLYENDYYYDRGNADPKAAISRKSMTVMSLKVIHLHFRLVLNGNAQGLRG